MGRSFPKSFLLLSLLIASTLGSKGQMMEKDPLGKDMFSIGVLGMQYDHELDASYARYQNRDRRGRTLGRGVRARWDKAIGNAGSGIGTAVSYLQMDGPNDEDQVLRPSDPKDRTYLLHVGYFTRIHPFRWMPSLKGGLSKLRFEGAFGSDLEAPLVQRPSAGKYGLFASFEHARPLTGRSWLKLGLGLGRQDEMSLRAGWTYELSLALMIRSGERAPFP